MRQLEVQPVELRQVVIFVLSVVLVGFGLLAGLAVWSHVRGQRDVRLSEEAIHDRARRFFLRAEANMPNRDSFIRPAAFFADTRDAGIRDQQDIVWNVVRSGLLENRGVDRRTIWQGIGDYTYSRTFEKLWATDMGWHEMRMIREQRYKQSQGALGTRDQFWIERINQVTIIRKNSDDVGPGAISVHTSGGGKVSMKKAKLVTKVKITDLERLAAQLPKALRSDADSMPEGPDKAEVVALADELDAEEGQEGRVKSGESRRSRLMARFGRVSDWAKTIAGGLKATNEVIEEYRTLTGN